MSKTIAPDMAADENINYEEAVKQMLLEIKQSNEKMARDQKEIDQMKIETREILARLKTA